MPRLPCPACALQIKGRLSDLQAERQAEPHMQGDAALKEAALQVGAAWRSVHSVDSQHCMQAPGGVEDRSQHAQRHRRGGTTAIQHDC